MKLKINKLVSSKKRLSLLLAFLVMSCSFSQAQNSSFSNIKKAYLQSVKAIIANSEVKGYYAFYFMDKANKKENIYVLNIMDNNLKTLYSVELVKDKNLILMESSFNGKCFCFSFINYKKKLIEYMILDDKGEETGTYTTEKLSNSELQYMSSLLTSEDDVYSGGMIAIPGQGFVRYGMEKGDGWRYVMEMIDNKGKKIWDATSGNEDNKAFESASPMYANETTVATLVSTRARLMSKDMDAYCVFIDVSTGEEIFKTEPESKDSKKYPFQPVGISYDDNAKEYFLYGEYFNKGDKIAKDKSEGFYFQNLSDRGSIKKETFASWTGDISKVLPVNARGKMDGNMSVAIHNMVRTSDGKIFAIGEQYKKAVSASGVAMNVLSAAAGGGSGQSVMKIELHDMVIFEFDSDLKIKKGEIFEKEKTNIQLASGYGSLSTPMLGFIMKSYGWFDYNYTVCSGDKKTFSCAYTNYDRSKEESSNYVVGNISYSDDKLVIDKIRLSKKPTSFMVMPAKPGYIAIMEYYRKKKVIDIRLEKLNN